MVLSHGGLICGGNNCPIAEPAFRDETCHLANTILNQVFSTIKVVQPRVKKIGVVFYEPDQNSDSLFFRFSAENKLGKNDIALFDSELGFQLAIQPICSPYKRKSILTQFIAILNEQVFGKGPIQHHETSIDYSPAIQLLLWCSILAENAAILTKVLQATRRDSIPACTILSLLLSAIKVHFVDGVSALLDFGAPASIANKSYTSDRPISACVREFSAMKYRIKRAHGWDAYDPNSCVKLTKMLKMLLVKADVALKSALTSPFANCYSALWDIPIVAVFSPEAAEMLINAGRHFLVNDSPNRLTLMHTCATKIVEDGRDFPGWYNDAMKTKLAARLLASALVPLIRAGARGELRYSICKETAHFLNDERSMFTFGSRPICEQLWGRGDAFVDMLVEAQAYKLTGTIKFPVYYPEYDGDGACFYKYYDPDQDEQEDFIWLIRSKFPRRLQEISRQAVLHWLPLGLQARRNAIKDLPIPKPLQEYLDFPEFELLNPNLPLDGPLL